MKQSLCEGGKRIHSGLFILFLTALIASAINPLNQLFWFGQAVPAILIVSVLAGTYRKFSFTTFVYVVVFLHMLILLVGAHYTYSENPFFNFLKDEWGLRRNYFDRIGHFAQGFSPAFLTKEFLARGGYVKKGRMLSFIVIVMCLGYSAFYELLEFTMALVLGIPPEIVMGFQGDVWDSLWDMVMALIGALVAICIFGSVHDKRMDERMAKDGL